LVPDIWFVAGVSLGAVVAGFCAIDSFGRGSDSVRREWWSLEHEARKRAFLASRMRLRAPAQANVDVVVPKAS
jgi:hypothetical protein